MTSDFNSWINLGLQSWQMIICVYRQKWVIYFPQWKAFKLMIMLQVQIGMIFFHIWRKATNYMGTII